MAKKVIVTLQGLEAGMQSNIKKEIIVDDDFELYDDYYAYQTGAKQSSHGNDILGAMIGNNYYARFSDVIDISVEEIPEEPPIEMTPIEPPIENTPEQLPVEQEEVMPDE